VRALQLIRSAGSSRSASSAGREDSRETQTIKIMAGQFNIPPLRYLRYLRYYYGFRSLLLAQTARSNGSLRSPSPKPFCFALHGMNPSKRGFHDDRAQRGHCERSEHYNGRVARTLENFRCLTHGTSGHDHQFPLAILGGAGNRSSWELLTSKIFGVSFL
jgi:hypothetical protein